MGRAHLILLTALAALANGACDKVPLVDIHAYFTLAEAAWFEEEETLFFFWRLDAMQGLGPDTQLEVTYRTDDVALPWTALDELSPVHTHLPVDCGITGLCGSMSLKVSGAPREVGLRLRYHRDGELVRDAFLNVVRVGRGPPHTNRSLLVYGVFDETNTLVQWRGRHQFPTLRNEEAQQLGLRRRFTVSSPRHGDVGAMPEGNVYGYGFSAACPTDLAPLDHPPLTTDARAIFEPTPLPLSASTSPVVCAEAAVVDGRGAFQTAALARKNPQVAPAFAALRSPIRENTRLAFLLRPCARELSEPHLAMQRQRLLLESPDEVCLDDWEDPGFTSLLAGRLQTRIDQARLAGNDMVLVIAFHHDDASGQLARKLEQALETVLPSEGEKSSPRVSGAFVFDSRGYLLQNPTLSRLVLWCPAIVPGVFDDLDALPSVSQQACALVPQTTDLDLGPFRVANLPILPTRPQYLTFIDRYSEDQAGRMTGLSFRAPERTPLSENLEVGPFGVATFFNNEVITAAPSDVFSFCSEGNPRAGVVVFRTSLSPDPFPLALLPDTHLATAEQNYALGIVWDFPFLVKLDYEVVVAGAATAFAITVPFGIASPAEAYYGALLWQEDTFPLAETLLKCTRFCGHPTFDSSGVYNVVLPFDQTYRNLCYRPRYPAVGDGGFPRDP